jgi:hypothetical protein
VRSYEATAVYELLHDRRFPILNEPVFAALGRAFAEVRFVAAGTLAPIPLGPTVGGEGSLLRVPGEAAVWKIEAGQRRPFVGAWTESAFRATTGWGFDGVFDRATPALLARYPQGAPISAGGGSASERLVNAGFEDGEDDLFLAEDGGWGAYSDVAGLGSCAQRTGDAAVGNAYGRCTISGSAVDWHVQFGQRGLAISNGMACHVAVRARSSATRTIKVVLQQHLGGTGYGLSFAVTAGPTWARYETAFQVAGVAAGGDPDARLTFWMGSGGSGAVDLDDITFMCP